MTAAFFFWCIHTAPLSLTDWALLAAVGAMLLMADEIRKLILRRRAAGRETAG